MNISDRPMLLAADGRDIEELDDDAIWDGLAVHGAILFRGFGIDADGFYRYASRFSKGFLVSPFGDRKSVSDKNELQTVTLGQGGLSLHFEYGNSPMRPDLLWFYCRQAPREGSGGETLIADGASILDRLSAGRSKELHSRRIRYRNYVPPQAFEDILVGNSAIQSLTNGDVMSALRDRGLTVIERNERCVAFDFVTSPVTEVGDSGRYAVSQNVFTNAYKRPGDQDAEGSFSTQVTWEDGSDIHPELLRELKEVTRSLTRGIRWRKGDFVLIDNFRMLHGRNQTTDPERDLVMLCSFSKRFRLPN